MRLIGETRTCMLVGRKVQGALHPFPPYLHYFERESHAAYGIIADLFKTYKEPFLFRKLLYKDT